MITDQWPPTSYFSRTIDITSAVDGVSHFTEPVCAAATPNRT